MEYSNRVFNFFQFFIIVRLYDSDLDIEGRKFLTNPP